MMVINIVKQVVHEVISIENSVVHYSGEFYSDDVLKDWPPILSFVAFMPSVFSPSIFSP